MSQQQQLSAGSVAAIKRSLLPAGTKPVVQILTVTPLQVQNSERFKLEISDGQHFTVAMLATQHNGLVKSNQLRPHTILRIREFITNEVQQKQIIILLDVEVMDQSSGKLGNPFEYAGDSQGGAGSNKVVAPPPKSFQPQPQFQQQPPQQQPQYQQPQYQQPPQFQQSPPQPQFQQQPQFKPSGPIATMQQRQPPIQPQFQQQPQQTSSYTAQPKLTPIRQLNPYQNKWTIKARVTSKTDVRSWDKGGSNTGKLFSVDLVDQEGSEIRATFFKEAVDSFYEVVANGGVYLFSDGRVKVANKQFTSIKNEYELSFDKSSHILPVADHDEIAKINVDPVPIASIANMDVKQSVDILGVVIDQGEVSQFTSKAGKELRKLELEVVDQSMASIRVSVWGTKADETHAQLAQAGSNPVVAFKSLLVGDFGGGKNLSSINSSGLMVNPQKLQEAGKLKSWFDSGSVRAGGVTALSAAKFGGGGGGGGAEGGGDGNRAPVPIEDRITFSQVQEFGLGRNGQADFAELKAHLMFVKKDGLFYPACRTDKCGKKLSLNPGSGRWDCEKCSQSFDQPDYRYIANFNVIDSTGHAWCTAFGAVGDKVFGCTANELKQWEDADKNQFNQIIEAAQFSEAVFRIKVKEESYQNNTKIKTAIMGMRPVDHVRESRELLRGIALLQQRI
ncbi:hypothetical protein BASA82_000609 [Batrachochytrium salamandrivorans]|nr:hypothetical protein BASA82_000609 [Batrachochytrium salamandrivorans]